MSQRIKLKRSFFDKPPELVAPNLLGKELVTSFDTNITSGVITEIEAYHAEGDPAAHSYKGKTKNNQALYNGPGHAYIHRMHGWNLLDIVCRGGSVLIRSLDPQKGIEKMMKLRSINNVENLTNGPGKICQALGITHSMNGMDITLPSSPLYVIDNPNIPEVQVAKSTRIGITKGKDSVLRFYINDQI